MASKIFEEALEQIPQGVNIYVQKYVDLTKRINEILEKKSMSRKEFAKELGKAGPQISKWLNGEHNLTLRTISEMEAVLEEDLLVIPKRNTWVVKATSCEGFITRSNEGFIMHSIVKENKKTMSELIVHTKRITTKPSLTYYGK